MATSAEMLALIEHVETEPNDRLSDFAKTVDENVSLIRRSIDKPGMRPADSNIAMNIIGKLGACALLRDEQCSVYEARPYACRAVHVWHDSSECIHSVERGIPGELIIRRNSVFWDTLEKEALSDRLPFYGQLTVGIFYLLKYRELYLSGSEFSTIIDPLWWQTGIINFPYENRNSTPQDAVRTIRNMKRQDEMEYAKERPYGLFRATGVASREVLIEMEGQDLQP